MRRANRAVVAASLFLTLSGSAFAETKFELKGKTWVNGKEVSLEALRGKIAVVYLYEQD